MNLSKNSSGSLGLLLSAFIVVLVAGIAIVASSEGSALQVKNSSKNLAAAGAALKGAPGQPTSLVVVDNGDLSVYATWEDPSEVGDYDITSYILYYSTGEGKDPLVRSETVTKRSAIITDLTAESSYSFYVAAINSKGEGPDSEPVTLEMSIPRFSATEATATVSEDGRSVNLSWTTSYDSTYSIVYSPINDSGKGKEVLEAEVIPTTSHSADISGLVKCSKYWYFITSLYLGEKENFSVETSGEFLTGGCKGGSSILSIASDNLTSSKSASLETNGGSRKILVSAPSDLKQGQTDIYIQAAKLEKENVKNVISTPTGKTWAGEAYSLKAFDSNLEEVGGSFDKSVTVTIDFTEEDVAGLDSDSLKIYHYEDGTGWRALNNCSKEYSGGAGSITCTTTSFSIFGLFGEESEGDSTPTPTPEPSPVNNGGSNGGSSGSTSSGSRISSTPVNNQTTETIKSDNKVVVQEVPVVVVTSAESSGKSFTKDLGYGTQDSEVKLLQQSLNQLGFELSNSGAGSVGSETNFFGPLTKSALIKFQEKNREEVLDPIGLTSGTGYFGTYSRKVMKALLGR